MNNTKLLKFISSYLYIIGWAFSFIAILIGLILTTNSGPYDLFFGIALIFVGPILGALLLALSGLILLFQKIEENTRH